MKQINAEFLIEFINTQARATLMIMKDIEVLKDHLGAEDSYYYERPSRFDVETALEELIAESKSDE